MQNSLIAILKCQIQKNINLEEEIKICPEYIQNKHTCNTKNTDIMYRLYWYSVCFLSFQYRYEYHWADGTNIKKPIKCSAPKYIDYLMTWVQDQLDDETLFPSKIGIIVLVNWDPSWFIYLHTFLRLTIELPVYSRNHAGLTATSKYF